MRASIAVGICALALLAFSIYAVLQARKKRPMTAAPQSPSASTLKPTELPAPSSVSSQPAAEDKSGAGLGTILGEVVLIGSPPARTLFKVGADPICARSPPQDEQVLVKDGRLQNVVVRIAQNLPGESAPQTPIEVNQEGCTFRPHVQGAVAGQRLLVRNSDPTLHNVHGYADSSTLFNWAQPPSSPPRETPLSPASRILKLKCDMHPWMTSYVVITGHHFFSTTGEDGVFRISGVPAGDYELEAWHERYGVSAKTVRVVPGQLTEVKFAFSAN